jgi:Peptidase S24-like
MDVETLWKVLPFPNIKHGKMTDEIKAENWTNLDDFLTNGSDGVLVGIVKGSNIPEVPDGYLIVIDKNLAPESGDIVVELEEGEAAVRKYRNGADVFGVVVCVIQPLQSHRRQRRQRTG